MEGRKYELQRDGTHTIYEVKYDERGREVEKKEVSKGHKIV